MIDAFTCWASKCGAPGVGWRTTITSAPIASMFLAVSRMAMISAADRSSSPSRCFRVQLDRGLMGAGTDAVPEPELELGGDAMVTAQGSCQAVKGGKQPRRGRFLPRDQADAAAPERDRCDRSADAVPRSRAGWVIHDVRDPPARPVESVPAGPGRKSRSAPR